MADARSVAIGSGARGHAGFLVELVQGQFVRYTHFLAPVRHGICARTAARPAGHTAANRDLQARLAEAVLSRCRRDPVDHGATAGPAPGRDASTPVDGAVTVGRGG